MADIPSKSEYVNTQSNLVRSNLEEKAEPLLKRIASELNSHRPLPFTFYIHQELVLPRNADYAKYTGQYSAIIEYVVEIMKQKGWSISFMSERDTWGGYEDNNITVTIK